MDCPCNVPDAVFTSGSDARSHAGVKCWPTSLTMKLNLADGSQSNHVLRAVAEILPGSLHPSGRQYQVVSGDFTKIPTIPKDRADALLAAARLLDEMGKAEREAKPCTKCRTEADGQDSVIDLFNKTYRIETVLGDYRYERHGDRFKRPGGKSDSVAVLDGRSYHHSSNDPLHDGYSHDAFDVFCTLGHGGDCKAAFKAAAELLEKVKSRDYSLLPQLNGKVVVIKDFTVIHSMPSEARNQVLSILRDAYDGFSSRALGNSEVKCYHSRFNMLTGMTPDIERSWSLSTLGERFLMWRIVVKDRREHLRRGLRNVMASEGAAGIRKELQQAVKQFISSLPRIKVEIDEAMQERLFDLAELLATCRTYVYRERNDDIVCQPQAELATRVGKQLMARRPVGCNGAGQIENHRRGI